MVILTIVTAVAAGLTLALLALVLKQLSDLRAAMKRVPDKAPASTARAGAADDRLAAVEDRLRLLGAVLGRIEATLSDRRMAAPIAAAPRPAPTASAPTPATPTPVPTPAPAADPRLAPIAAQPPSAVPATALEAETDAAGGGPDALLDAYRALIAQPRKNEINAWVEATGGEGCELGEDGNFVSVPRESGPLLILVPFGERAAMVVPSARLVLDFATSFADSLTLRPALRQSFELTADGSGMLRLMEPATATKTDGVWRLRAAGQLAGMAS